MISGCKVPSFLSLLRKLRARVGRVEWAPLKESCKDWAVLEPSELSIIEGVKVDKTGEPLPQSSLIEDSVAAADPRRVFVNVVSA